jgi:hypothetical protein
MNRKTLQSASGKHLDDVEFLYETKRFDNAAYLAGYVAECALKTLLISQSLPSTKELGHDLHLMTGSAIHLAIILSPELRRYPIPTSPAFIQFVRTWKPDERYDAFGTTTAALADERVSSARETYLLTIVPQLLDGEKL